MFAVTSQLGLVGREATTVTPFWPGKSFVFTRVSHLPELVFLLLIAIREIYSDILKEYHRENIPSGFTHDYTLHNHTLESVSSAKYLGVTLQSDIKWNLHIDNIASNANKSLGFIKRNLKVSNTDIKSKAYQALVRPKLEYSCSVWDPNQSQHIHKLEMVQRRAARFVCNNYHNTSSVTDMVNTLQWPPLADRRLKSRLVIFYKIVYCLIAVPANHILIPTDSRTRHSHSLYHTDTSRQPKTHTNGPIFLALLSVGIPYR